MPCWYMFARIPFVAEGRNRVDAPVDEDAELGVLIPGGHLVALERVPVGAERSVLCPRIDFAEQRGARGVELVDGFLPDHIIRVGSLRRSRQHTAKKNRVESHEAPREL